MQAIKLVLSEFMCPCFLFCLSLYCFEMLDSILESLACRNLWRPGDIFLGLITCKLRIHFSCIAASLGLFFYSYFYDSFAFLEWTGIMCWCSVLENCRKIPVHFLELQLSRWSLRDDLKASRHPYDLISSLLRWVKDMVLKICLSWYESQSNGEIENLDS